jgi:hypothetical protein
MVFQGTPFNTQIPAKIYEYFRAGKPILGLVDTAGEPRACCARAVSRAWPAWTAPTRSPT